MFIKKYIFNSEISTNPSFIKTISISPNNIFLVAGCWDNSIKVYDLQTSRLIKNISGHTDAVYSIAISPDNNYFASSSCDKTIRLWDFKTLKCINILKGHEDCVNILLYCPEGKYIVSGSRDRSIKIWNPRKSKSIRSLKGHIGSVEALDISPDGDKVVSGSTDGSIKVWDLKNKNLIFSLEDIGTLIHCLKVSPSGDVFLSNFKNKIQFWNIENGDLLYHIGGHIDNINVISISENGKYIISGSESGEIILWDFLKKEVIKKIDNNHEIETLILLEMKNQISNFIDSNFIHSDKEGNVVQWLFIKDEIKKENIILDKLSEDDLNSLLSDLTLNKISFAKVANDYNLDKEDIIKFIKKLYENKIIGGFFDGEQNFYSYIYLENAIYEVLNLSGRIKISDISRSIEIHNQKTLEILQNMISEEKVKGFFDINESTFISHEQLMSEIISEIKKNKIIYTDQVKDLFSIKFDIYFKVINDIKNRGDLEEIDITDNYVKFKYYELEEPPMLAPEEIIEEIQEVPQEIEQEEIKPTEIIEEPQEIVVKSSESQIQNKDKIKSIAHDYIKAIETMFLKCLKIFEILEIPAFCEEYTMFFDEIMDILNTKLNRFAFGNFKGKFSVFRKSIEELTTCKETEILTNSHKVEKDILEILENFLKESKLEIEEYTKSIGESKSPNFLKESYDHFFNLLSKYQKIYIENIVDSIVIIDTNSYDLIFYYRFRPIYYENLIEDIKDLITNSRAKKTLEDLRIVEYKSIIYRIYSRDGDNYKIILVTTGEYVPQLLKCFNSFIKDIEIKEDIISEKELKNIKECILSNFKFN